MASMARRCSLTVLLCLTPLHLVLPCPDVCTCTFGNTVVNCNDKSLQTVPQDIPASVTSLMLRSNDISQLSNSSFAGLSLLYSLNLQSNKIRQIPKGVFASSIRYLYLKNNLISDITSGAFDDLSLLRELYLDNNAITNIQYGTFHGLVDLQTLSLISNAIDSVSNDSFSGLTKLRNLYLQDNAITTIPVGPFKRFPNIATLYIHNNPLRCDCELHDLVQWFNTGGRYLGDPSALNCASSPFPDLVGVSLNNAASQLSICVSAVTDVISTSSNQTPTIPHLSSKINTPTTKGFSTSPSRNTTTTNVVNTSSKRTVTKTISASPPKTTPSSNASEAITTLRSTTPTTTHPSVRDTTVSSSIESKGNDTTPKAATINTVHSVSVRSSVTRKPSSTSGSQTKSNVDNRQTAPLNTTRATPRQSSGTTQIFSSLQEKTTTPRPYLTTKSKGHITAAGGIINKHTTGKSISSQNNTVLQISSTPSKTTTSTKSSLTTRSTMATTKSKTTANKVTTTEQGSTTLNSTILQVTPTPQETSTKAHPVATSSVVTLKQNTTTAEKTIQDTTSSPKALPPKRGTISVTEHLIGIEDVTVGETVTIRCDAASPSENITYKWSVDGKQDPDYIGPILRYIPQTNGSHRIQCTAHTEDGEGVSDIITLFVKPEDIQSTISPNKTTTTTTTTATITTVNETTTVRTYTSSIFRSSTVHTTQKSTTNHTTPFQSTKASTSQAQSTSRQVSTAQTAVNTTSELQTTTKGVNVTIPKPNILIENAGEDSATPGNGSAHVIRVTEHIIGIQDITVGETVTIRCDAEDRAAVCVMYKWRVDGEVLDGQNGQILRYTPETDGPHKIQCTAINNGMDGVSDVITVFALPKGKKLDVMTRCDKDPHSGVSWDNIVRDCDLHLHELAEIPVTSMNALDVAGKLKNITTSDNVTVDNVGDVRMIFENVVNASSQPEVGYSLLETVDQLMDTDDDVLQNSQKVDSSPSKIVQAMEENNDRIDLTDGKFSHIGKNVGVEVFEMRPAELADGVVFALLDDGSDTLNNATVRTYIGEDAALMPADEVVASIALPDQLALEATSDDVRLSFTIFQSSKLFQTDPPVDVDRGFLPQTINSKVIAGRISGLQTKNLSKPVVLKYLPVDRRNMTNITCVFWDFAANNGGGAWSSDGCSFGGVNKGRIVCECHHLTNFAVLTQHTVHQNDFAGLIVICKILCGLMIIGLAFTLITHVAFEQLRQYRSQVILMNICFALLATLVSVLLGIGWTENDASCRAVTFFLHYFLLAYFAWTAIEAYNMNLAFEKDIADSMKRFILKTAVAGWGFPFAIALITLVSDVQGYRSDNFCWLEGNQLLIGFLLPGAVVLCFNTVTYIIIVRKLRQPDEPKDGKLHDNVTKKTINLGIIIMILMGLQWILGFILIRDAELAAACVFFVLSSLQGLFVALFRCLLQEDVRSHWLTCCSRDADTSTDDAVTSTLLKTPSSPPESNDVEKSEKKPIEDEEAVPLVITTE